MVARAEIAVANSPSCLSAHLHAPIASSATFLLIACPSPLAYPFLLHTSLSTYIFLSAQLV